MSTSLAPLVIQLNGDYSTPFKKSGSVTGDLRLAELDAFLAALRDTLEHKKPARIGNKFSKFLVDIAQTISKEEPHSVELVVTSKLDPAKHELSYTFSFNINNPK